MSTVDPTTGWRRFGVVGMTCSHCEHAITTEILRLPGVTAAIADADAGTVDVECRRDLDVAEVAAAIDEAGYELAR